ncbi:hypothetical protein B0H13DRAFT_1862863 [Mycena leptocephala]|nr:hypothetical protein B0H13DRAFT_1862863 [Mycena leptocephala]
MRDEADVLGAKEWTQGRKIILYALSLVRMLYVRKLRIVHGPESFSMQKTAGSHQRSYRYAWNMGSYEVGECGWGRTREEQFMGCSSECSESQSSVTASNETVWSTLTVIGHSGRGRDNGREGSRKSGERMPKSDKPRPIAQGRDRVGAKDASVPRPERTHCSNAWMSGAAGKRTHLNIRTSINVRGRGELEPGAHRSCGVWTSWVQRGRAESCDDEATIGIRGEDWGHSWKERLFPQIWGGSGMVEGARAGAGGRETGVVARTRAGPQGRAMRTQSLGSQPRCGNGFGRDFFLDGGDFVPAALRERNFFGGEHDFPMEGMGLDISEHARATGYRQRENELTKMDFPGLGDCGLIPPSVASEEFPGENRIGGAGPEFW